MTSCDAMSVSVVIPYYNREAFFEEALNSVRSQTVKPIEIIVVDDGSRLESAEFLKQFSNELKIIRLQENRGQSYARNVGVENASGSMIAFLDSDDVWEPAKLEQQVAYLQANPSCCAVHTGCVVFFHDGHEERYLSKPSPLTMKELIVSSHVAPSSLMIRTDVFRSLGGFDPSFRLSEDYEFEMRMVTEDHRIDFIPRPLTRMRRVGHARVSSSCYRFLMDRVRIVWRYRRYHKELTGRGATRKHIAKCVREAGRKRGGIIGRSLFVGGWFLGREIPD